MKKIRQNFRVSYNIYTFTVQKTNKSKTLKHTRL